MGVWLGPRGQKKLVIDLASLTAKGDKWNGTEGVDALAPSVTPSTGVVSITKHWTGNWETGYGNDKAGIAVSDAIPNLTDYSKITVAFSDLNSNGHVAVYVSTSNTDFVKTRDLHKYDFSGSTVELDLSELPDGTYYFGIAIEAAGRAESTQDITQTITISSIKATK